MNDIVVPHVYYASVVYYANSEPANKQTMNMKIDACKFTHSRDIFNTVLWHFFAKLTNGYSVTSITIVNPDDDYQI